MSAQGQFCGRLFSLCLIVSSFSGGFVQGQEFSIYTRVYHDTDEKPARQPVCRSHTLLHANRGYDYIAELGQVTISDFGTRRVTVLHGTRKLAAGFTFDELQKQIEQARDSAEEFLRKPIQQAGFDSNVTMDFIRFQLHPEFQEVYDSERRRLTLSSDVLTYEATCAPPPTLKTLETYLKFTDWTAQVNYVLVAQAMLPGPRMELNEVLRSKEVLPVKVILTTHVGPGVKLRAEHLYKWELEKKERDMIHQWDTLLEDEETRVVSLSEFQAILAEDNRSAAKPTTIR